MLEGRLAIFYKIIFASIILVYVAWGIAMGSKSGVLGLLLFSLFIIIVQRKPMFFRFRELFLLGILGILSVGFFVLGKIFRHLHAVEQDASWGSVWYVFDLLYLQKGTLIELIHAISSRIGHIDYFIQKISLITYEQYINFSYYFKAVVDKITPGFDLFDAAFMSRMIYSSYHGDPGKFTNSEFVTIFGEAYILFGFFSPVFFVLSAIFLKWILSTIDRYDFFKIGRPIMYVYLLQMFYFWFVGMGLDMLFTLYMLYRPIFYISIIFMMNYWYNKRCLPIDIK